MMKRTTTALIMLLLGAGSLTACSDSDDDCGSDVSAAAFSKPRPGSRPGGGHDKPKQHVPKPHGGYDYDDDCDDLSVGPSMRTPVAILPAPPRFRPVKRVPIAIIPAPSWWH